MKVNHKTFAGGYKFDNFEGQPSKELMLFKPVKDVTGPVIEPSGEVSASDVLNALNLTDFSGNKSTLVNTKGEIKPHNVKDIIVSIVEVEPYDLPIIAILTEATKKFIKGLQNLHESYGNAKVTLILDENQSALIQRLSKEIEKLGWVEICTIASKYPANFKELTIPAILGKKYPVGYSPAHLGILYLSASDVLHVSTVVSEKKAAEDTYVALSGPGWKENRVLIVPVGTSIRELTNKYLGDGEIRLIENSLLTGSVLTEEDIVSYDTTVIIALPEDRRRQTLFFLRAGKNTDSFSNTFLSRLLPKAEKTVGTNLHGERRACVSCTYCESVCPAGLIPHLLHKHADKNIINKRLAEYNIFDCIECGLCNYVCPSKIEVLSNIKIAKEELEKAEISHNKYVIPQCDLVTETREVASGE